MLLDNLAGQGSNTRIQLSIGGGGVCQGKYHGFKAKLVLIFEQNLKEETHRQRAEVWRQTSEIILVYDLLTGFRGGGKECSITGLR